MRMTYEKHQKELSERLERSVQENSAMVELQTALNGERLRVDELQVFFFSFFDREVCSRSQE